LGRKVVGLIAGIAIAVIALLLTSIIDDGIHQFSIQKIPSHADRQVVLAAINQGIKAWEGANPDMEFEQVTKSADFSIIWVDDISEVSDAEGKIGFYDGENITIELGSIDCRDRWQQYSKESVSDTIAHEVGHYLGLKHHANESHLMYGSGDKTNQVPFDDLGYNIPFQNLDYQKWIATDGMEYEIETLAEEIDTLNKKLEKYPTVISDEKEFEKAKSLENQRNDKVEVYNDLVEKFNCVSKYEE